MGCDYDANVKRVMQLKLHNIVQYGDYIDEVRGVNNNFIVLKACFCTFIILEIK